MVTVVDITMHGSDVLTLTYRTADGMVAERLVYRDDEPRLTIVEEGKPWSFDGDGDAFKLVSEAKRIDLAYLFDPYVAVSTSLVEPLPHQITAVYEAMLPRQPLSFLLADDPGAAGLPDDGAPLHTAGLGGPLILAPTIKPSCWYYGAPDRVRAKDAKSSHRIGSRPAGEAEADLLPRS